MAKRAAGPSLIAADRIDKGQYEAAREALGDLWRGVGQRPTTERRHAPGVLPTSRLNAFPKEASES